LIVHVIQNEPSHLDIYSRVNLVQRAEDQPTSTDPRAGRSAAQQQQSGAEQPAASSGLDLDQTASDSDQTASDEDQAASNQESAAGDDQRARDAASVHRVLATQLREENARARLRIAVSRDITADERAQTAAVRDSNAESHDDSVESLTRGEQALRAARDYEQAKDDRASAARDRVGAAADRASAAHDQARAAEERAESATHKDRATEQDQRTGRYTRRQEPSLAGGYLLAAISTSVVGILRKHYGRGPMKAKTYALDDIIVVVMRGSGFTALEQTIMDSGEPDRVIAMRENFQRVMAKLYRETIEELTGRKVLAFLSQAHVEPDITMEIFFIDGPLEGFGAVELTELVD
jgi:uncharacterized protein YbcI